MKIGAFRGRQIERNGAFANLSRFGDIGPAPKTCQFPLWNGAKPTHEYCQAETVPGREYCTEHLARCRVAKAADA